MSSDDRDVDDLFALDRDVARAVSAWRTWRHALFTEPETHADEDVFLLPAHRRVATKSLFDALTAKTAPPDLQEAFRHWVAFLLQARLTREVDVALAREISLVQALSDEEQPTNYRQAWRGVVTETARGRSLAWFEAAAARGPAVAALRRERRARRHEVLRRLGLEGELVPPPLTVAPLETLAQGILDATADLTQSLLREEQKREGVARPHPVDAIRLAMARSAREGWPARLSQRWLHDLFSGWLSGVVRFPLDTLPAALGAASFARALEAFGRAFRTAQFESNASLPFVLREDPHFVDAHRMGALTAQLVANPIFHRRALGLGKDAALLQARTLGKTLLFSLRLGAARVLLADESRWDEVSARLFGEPAPRTLAGAWPEYRDDEGARLVGASTARVLASMLVDQFDEDWFVNPRAAEVLRARTLYPASIEDTLEPSQIVRDLGRTFEELFG